MDDRSQEMPDSSYGVGYSGELDTIRIAFDSDDKMARILNVDPHQIAGWRMGGLPSIEEGVRIRVLAEAVRRLLEFYDPSIVPGWFSADAGHGVRDHMFSQGAYDQLFREIGEAEQGAFV